jgi:hypothetical protein
MGIEIFSSARLDCMQCQEFSQRHNPSYQGWSQQHRNLGPVATFQNSFLVLGAVGTSPFKVRYFPNHPKLVKTNNGGKPIINHPPVITINRWDSNHSQSWVAHDIVLPTLGPNCTARFSVCRGERGKNVRRLVAVHCNMRSQFSLLHGALDQLMYSLNCPLADG